MICASTLPAIKMSSSPNLVQDTARSSQNRDPLLFPESRFRDSGYQAKFAQCLLGLTTSP
jgi:hypothetical protein